MRVLVSTTAGAGHLGPLTAFARPLRDAGHDVAVAAPASFAAAVERAGFAHLSFADADPEALGRVFASLPNLPYEEAAARVAREVFCGHTAQAALPGVRSIIEDWRPDLLVREPAEFASLAVAAELGLPHVRIGIGLVWHENRFTAVLDEPLAALGYADGVAGLRRERAVSLLPESFEDPEDPGSRSIRRFRDPSMVAGGGGDPLPAWWDESLAADPLVYVTFGSVAATHGAFAQVHKEAVAAVAGRPWRVLLTTGDGADLDGLGPVPPNVHVEKWFPQQQVMAHADAMVGHGGFGTTLQALAAGMPSVVVPLFADQPYNAARIAAVGAGVALDGGIPAVADGLGPAIERVLADPSYRAGARRIAADIAALPPVAEAVPLFEELATIR